MTDKMKSSLKSFFICCIIPVFLIAQNKKDTLKSSVEQVWNKEYVSSINEFGFNLLKKMAVSDPGKNVFISPTSIFYALAMANNGAEGTTGEAIRSVLQLPNITRNKMNTYSTQLAKFLVPTDTCAELNMAISMWLNQQYKLKDEFRNECVNYYSSELFVRDFASPSTVKEINNWVTDKTKGKITSIIDNLTPADFLILLNAIYFSGKWSYPFQREGIAQKIFYFLDGTTTKYPRMSQRRVFDYYENSDFQVVSLPYGKQFSICIFLPRERDDLPHFIKYLKEKNWIRSLGQLKGLDGVVELPRFKIDYEVQLNDVLKSLGMEIAFSKHADFSRIADSLYISEVRHKTYLEVNEQGTKAAAVTSIRVATDNSAYYVLPPLQFTMIIDHPFFCAIKENRTGLILFAGSIFDPKSDPYLGTANENAQSKYSGGIPDGKIIVDSIYVIGSNASEKIVFPADGIRLIENRFRYPELARRAGLEGKVKIEFRINKSGEVVYSKILHSDAEIFNVSCLDGLQRIKFPISPDSKVVDKTILLIIKYTLIGNK